MRILYDGMIYAMQQAGGINRYFANVIGRLPKNYWPTLTTLSRRKINYPAHSCLQVRTYRPFRPGRLSRAVEVQYFKAIEEVGRYDIVHPTYYSLLSRRDMSDYRVPIVLTIYDMIHEILPTYMDASQSKVSEQKRKAVAAAQAIICISENTKQDLIEYCKVSEDKIVVTYLASEIDDSMSHGAEPVPERPYFLYVGSRAAYKNFDRLLLAIKALRENYPEIALCVVGASWTSDEQRRIAELGLADMLMHIGNTTDSHLAKLYRCSQAFVYPSLYEGFGIPPLEAMACGTIVIASNASSLPEVMGESGLMFTPTDTDELIDQMRCVCDGTLDREAMVSAGHLQAAKFSWAETAVKTVETYQAVAN